MPRDRWAPLRVLLLAGLSCVMGIGLIIYSVRTAYVSTRRVSEEHALQLARVHARQMTEEIDDAFAIARTLAASLGAVKAPEAPLALTRAQADALLRQVLVDNPQLAGVYTLWEPNAFDGLDAQYVSAGNQTGRYSSYWYRGQDGQLQPDTTLAANPEASDWYACARKSGRECLIDPYGFSTADNKTHVASVVVPIQAHGQFYGTAEVDFSLANLQKLTEQANEEGDFAEVALTSNNGTVVGISGHPELSGTPARVYEPATVDPIMAAIRANQESVTTDDDYFVVVIPLTIGKTQTPWAASFRTPITEITAGAGQFGRNLALGSLICVLLGVAAWWLADKAGGRE